MRTFLLSAILTVLALLTACANGTETEPAPAVYTNLHHALERAGYHRTNFGDPEEWTLFSKKEANGQGRLGTEKVVVTVDVRGAKIIKVSWPFSEGAAVRVDCPASVTTLTDLPTRPNSDSLELKGVDPDTERIERTIGGVACEVTLRK